MMKKILLASQGRMAYYHTPVLISLLRKAGCEVSLASVEGGLPQEASLSLCGQKLASLDGEGYDAVMLAPWESDFRPEFGNIPCLCAPVHGGGEGMLASLPWDEWLSGYGEKEGLASPAQCLEAALTCLTKQDYAGKTLLLTSGPTIEDADPARYVSNRSTGRMGCAIARMAARRGASVILVHGPMQSEIPRSPRVHPVPVRSAVQMLAAVEEHIGGAQIAVLCAAVADFAPMQYSEEKIKKGKSPTFTLTMKRNPDILATVGALAQKPFLVGFAAESSHVGDNAMEKLERKHADLLCANDITAPGCGFAVDTNRLFVLGTGGYRREIPLASKECVAERLLDIIRERMPR